MGELAVSAAGGFIFMRAFRLVATSKQESGAESSLSVDAGSTKPMAGIGAALFLLAFIASEAMATIGALRH